VFISAVGSSPMSVRAMKLGAVDFLPKPVRAEVLFAKLQRYTGVRFVTPAGDSEAPAASFGSLGEDDKVRALGRRLREAAAIGSVADLDAITDELAKGGDAHGALGRRVAALTAAFDFDALLFSVPEVPVFVIAATEYMAGHASTLQARPWIRHVPLVGDDLRLAIDRLRAAGIPGERGALQEAPKRCMPPPRLEVHKPSAICFGATRLVSIPRRFIDIVQLFGRR